ncbi:MAG: zinc ribbon domain-containing protein [Desulfitobacterium hafniense]|uniref:hypothetical protein n=1 Tax=Desulfitobacterium hafniense TaxID=49338 RepID=UPI0003633D87|nr:hypothetical protein [Desulfitobacterium hafniense]
MFCRECGTEVGKKVKVCPNCGINPLHGAKHCQACGANTKAKQELCKKCGAQLITKGAPLQEEEAPKTAKAASFCMPVVGVILFFIWHAKEPEKAKSVCNWTIGGVAFGMILYVFGIVWGGFSAATGY